jgi:hypothetical protein
MCARSSDLPRYTEKAAPFLRIGLGKVLPAGGSGGFAER